MLRSGPLKVKIYTPWLIPNTGELWHHVYMQHLWVKGSKLNFCFWVVTLGAMAEGNSASVSLDGKVTRILGSWSALLGHFLFQWMANPQ